MIRPGLLLFAFVAGVILGGGICGCAHADPCAAGLIVEMPTQAQILSCQADARRLCGPYLDGPIDVIRACMIAHKPQLSETCRAAYR